MSAFRVSFDIDLSHLAPEADNTVESVRDVVTNMLLRPARKELRQAIQNAKGEGKADELAAALRSMLLTIQFESSVSIEALPEGFQIETRLPGER